MRIALPVVMLALLAACGNGGPAPLPADRIAARFPPGGVADVIGIDAFTRLPLRRAELVAPDGQATPAASIAAAPAPATTSYQPFGNSAAGGGFGAAESGTNAPVPSVVGTAPQPQTRLLATLSSAAIPLPDPVAYRRAWQKYQIRLRFGDPPLAETRVIPAPAPPPG